MGNSELEDKQSKFMLFESRISITQLIAILALIGTAVGGYINIKNVLNSMQVNLEYMAIEVGRLQAARDNRFTPEDAAQMSRYYDARIDEVVRRLNKLESE